MQPSLLWYTFANCTCQKERDLCCLSANTQLLGGSLWGFFLALLGQQRSRMLATLFKDERCQQLAAYGILEKMYLDRIIRGNQLQEFAAMLMPHQKATTADGMYFCKASQHCLFIQVYPLHP